MNKPGKAAPTRVCEEFLKFSQRGDLGRLEYLRAENCVQDWTVYRHKVSGDTPLHLAAREGHYDVVRYLSESWTAPCYRIEVANRDMKRPLHEAAQFSRPEVLEYLLQQGAAVDPLKRADWTPLMLACTKTGPEATRCVNSLLRHGAASGLRNKDGWSPLLVACRSGNGEVVKSLIKQSANVISERSKNGRWPLHVAAFHGHREIIDLILSEDPTMIECRDSSGSTPLLESVKGGDLHTVKHLLEHYKSDLKTVDKIGQNVLHFAAQSGNIEIIKFVLSIAESLRSQVSSLGITPMMLAEKNEQTEAVRVLSELK